MGPAGRSRVSGQRVALCVLTVTTVAGAEVTVQDPAPSGIPEGSRRTGRRVLVGVLLRWRLWGRAAA